MSTSTRRTLKVHLFDLLAAILFVGGKVTPEDLANHLYNEQWASEDKYDILAAVQRTLDAEMAMREGDRPEDHYGLRKHPNLNLYWLNYSVRGES